MSAENGHASYDRLADWMEARGWVVPAACYLGSLCATYGIAFGLLLGWPWFLLLAGVPLAWLVLRTKWHGFLRRLDREYPLSGPETNCSRVAS